MKIINNNFQSKEQYSRLLCNYNLLLLVHRVGVRVSWVVWLFLSLAHHWRAHRHTHTHTHTLTNAHM